MDAHSQVERRLEILKANLPAIQSLPCQHVHWHLVLEPPLEETSRLELTLLPDFKAATEVRFTERLYLRFLNITNLHSTFFRRRKAA